MRCGAVGSPHSSLLTLHSSLLTPNSSLLIPHSSLLTPHLTPHSSLLTPHSSLHTALCTLHSTLHSALVTTYLYLLHAPHSPLHTTIHSPVSSAQRRTSLAPQPVAPVGRATRLASRRSLDFGQQAWSQVCNGKNPGEELWLLTSHGVVMDVCSRVRPSEHLLPVVCGVRLTG